jgi:hypothetical protein
MLIILEVPFMPNPSDYKDKESFISACISKNVKEGLDQKQAAGKCYGIWDNAQKAKCESNIKKSKEITDKL